jgi:N-acyl-D-aspartate/D-glutamate deacylase
LFQFQTASSNISPDLAMHDLIIENALIFDGTGGPPRHNDVAIDHDRVTDVGPNLGMSRERIDAEGLALAPGIIDSHTHFDAQITWDPMVAPSPEHGVTTVLIGNCGFTIAPCKAEHRDVTMRNLVRVEGMSLKAMQQGINWDFETFSDYLGLLERQGVGPNVGAFVGHSSIRTYVMGEDAPLRAATPTEIDAMRQLVEGAIDAGAVGFATSTSPSHNGADGNPMPSRLAGENELRALVGVLGNKNKGAFMLTKGASTSVPWLETLAADTGRPVVVAALLHNSTDPDAVFQDMDDIEAARSRGNQMWGQVSCCPLSTEFSLRAPYPFEGIAAWKPAMQADSDESYKTLLADSSFRDSIRAELNRPAVVRLFNNEWEKLSVIETVLATNRNIENCTLAELARDHRTDPLDFLLDLALEENLDTTFLSVLLNSEEDAVARLLTHPCSSIALSDAGAHLTFFCDAGFGLHLLGHWVRDKQIMSMEEAIYRLTSQPATIYGIHDRGQIKAGAYADLLLFDPDTVGRGPARRTSDLPGGERRLTTDALGVHGVWVNGTRIVGQKNAENGPTLPGVILRAYD